MFEELAELLADKRKIAVVVANNPDVDSVGSALALADIFDGLGKEAFVYCRGGDTLLPAFPGRLAGYPQQPGRRPRPGRHGRQQQPGPARRRRRPGERRQYPAPQTAGHSRPPPGRLGHRFRQPGLQPARDGGHRTAGLRHCQRTGLAAGREAGHLSGSQYLKRQPGLHQPGGRRQLGSDTGSRRAG